MLYLPISLLDYENQIDIIIWVLDNTFPSLLNKFYTKIYRQIYPTDCYLRVIKPSNCSVYSGSLASVTGS
eukprot:UN01529